ncbi:MAG: C40 family peptidase [Micrococcales bacterium]
MAKKPSGRRRADVKVNVLEQFELTSRKSVLEKQAAKRARAEARAAKSAERVARMLEVENSVREGKTVSFTSRVVSGVSRQTFRRKLTSTLTFSVAAALFAAFTLPAYAFSPVVSALNGITGGDTQGLIVDSLGNQVVAGRGGAKTTTAAALRNATLSRYRTWSGYTAEDYLKNPPYDSATGAQIIKVASKYVGVPYVFGGSTPAGFDCSGFTRYVFAQFGIPLAHSVSAQSHRGKLIRMKDAQPGDLVIWNDGGHMGIYAGGWNMIHAPKPGDTVKLAKIYDEPYAVHFVRIYK